MLEEEVWYTLDEIIESENDDTLYCIEVDAPEKQFLIGEIGVPTHNTDEGKEDDSLKGEAQMIIGSIARLGRAAGTHIVLATQRPDAKLIPGETKANLGVRINCGHTNSTASSMILDSGEGTRVKGTPRGRLYVSIHGRGDHAQGFFASPSWIDEYLASQGMNPDGSPISQPKSRLAKLTDISQFEDGDLDEKSGVDNTSIIEKIRDEESDDKYDQISKLLEDDDSDDEDIDFDSLLNGEDDEFGESSEVEVEEEVEPDYIGNLGRPDLKGDTSDTDKFHRPEDDWDSELEALIEENNA